MASAVKPQNLPVMHFGNGAGLQSGAKHGGECKWGGTVLYPCLCGRGDV